MGRLRHVRDLDGIVNEIVDTMKEWGWRPFPDPPAGQRYRTPLEYRQEFNDPGTTNARKQELIAIRCGLRPPETVPV